MALNELFKAFGALRTNLKNLTKDVDPKDSRDETSEDLKSVSGSFDQITEALGSLEKEDFQKIQHEVMESITEQESFQQTLREVTKSLSTLQQKISNETGVRQKIEKNLPKSLKSGGAEKVFDGFSNVIGKVNNYLESFLKVGR